MEHQLHGQGQDRIASLWSCYQLCNWVPPREATFKKCHQLNENVLSARRFDVEEPRKRQSCNAAISSRNNRINRSADSKPFFQTLKKGVRTIANRMWKLRNLMNGDEKRRECAEWTKKAPLHIGVSSGVEPKRAIKHMSVTVEPGKIPKFHSLACVTGHADVSVRIVICRE